jgi:hypothetical protein
MIDGKWQTDNTETYMPSSVNDRMEYKTYLLHLNDADPQKVLPPSVWKQQLHELQNARGWLTYTK